MIRGGWFTTDGCCPGCDATVRRCHGWRGAELEERYECPGCGTFRYGAATQLPMIETSPLGVAYAL